MITAASDPIRRGRKYDQVLSGARMVFLRDGFERASVDDIAREAGVSKATLYSYFPEKSLLFVEMAMAECRKQTGICEGHACDGSATVADMLTTTARQMVALFVSETGRRVYRICLAESDRFPDLARAFFQSGRKILVERLADRLRAAAGRGDLAIEDPGFAAAQFVELCRADLHDRLLFGMAERPGEAEIARTVSGAVTMFLARYGRDHAASRDLG